MACAFVFASASITFMCIPACPCATPPRRSTTVGTIFPAYQSFKAIEDKRSNKQDEQWLTYWVIYGMMNLVREAHASPFLQSPYVQEICCVVV